ncbi:extensin family protein [Rhizobium sp. NTR19]|uniref:Extensin family protein n=1 Tax=Neorhizobium turbinariae TaxID=2937795 RepID=A0ABT0IKL0_9HYPH|nr:extensin family protein [Neorhizobium turbinariae]MCK8778412.1 extensin family protein [Neorhizobium turbinariae]
MKRHIVLILSAAVSLGAALPRIGPVPATKPEPPAQATEQPNPQDETPASDALAPPAETSAEGEAAKDPESGSIPTPAPKPEPTTEPAAPAAEEAPKPDDAAREPASKPEKEKEVAEPPPPPLVKEDPEELKACMAELATLGTKYESKPRIDEGEGCGIESPIAVTKVLPGIDVGGATMRCKTAVTMAHWLKDTVQPALNIAMPGRKITGLVAGSTYACRLRNSASTGKISEHARGNAFDVASFKLDNGETISMKPRDEDSTLEGAFQRTATAGACLHFTTVLSPGSDEAHEDHLHLDILERTNGYRYCR